eukprot:g13977.t1
MSQGATKVPTTSTRVSVSCSQSKGGTPVEVQTSSLRQSAGRVSTQAAKGASRVPSKSVAAPKTGFGTTLEWPIPTQTKGRKAARAAKKASFWRDMVESTRTVSSPPEELEMEPEVVEVAEGQEDPSMVWKAKLKKYGPEAVATVTSWVEQTIQEKKKPVWVEYDYESECDHQSEPELLTPRDFSLSLDSQFFCQTVLYTIRQQHAAKPHRKFTWDDDFVTPVNKMEKRAGIDCTGDWQLRDYTDHGLGPAGMDVEEITHRGDTKIYFCFE